MAKKKLELSTSERIATLEKRIAEKINPNSKVINSKGEKVGSVKLRYKQIADGRLSLYLDIYKDGRRVYDFLGIYLDSSKVVSERNIGTDNENAILDADSRRAAKVEDVKFGNDVENRTNVRSKMLLIDWMQAYSSLKKKTGQSDAFSKQIDKAIRHLKLYGGAGVAMKDVDKSFCLGFIDYLNGLQMSDFTRKGYFRCLNCALNRAVKEDVISYNPITKIDNDQRIKQPESTREYLTVDEVKTLIATDCINEATKRAYLFSCFCGLRYSDIKALTWGDITSDGGQYLARIVMVKTQKTLYLPLSKEALRWMPERGDAKDGDKVFTLPSQCYLNVVLRTWAANSGLTKHVTFHTARHTFATLELTAGADIYTVSKLLGHTQVKTTQIYADIIDEKKTDAVNKIGKLFD